MPISRRPCPPPRRGARAAIAAARRVLLAFLTLPPLAAALGAEIVPEYRKPSDMATRLNEATVDRALALAGSLLPEPAGNAAIRADFLGPRPVIVDMPPRGSYQTIGTVNDAIGEMPPTPGTGLSISVKVGRVDADADLSVVDDPAVVLRIQPGQRFGPAAPTQPPWPQGPQARPAPGAGRVGAATPQAMASPEVTASAAPRGEPPPGNPLPGNPLPGNPPTGNPPPGNPPPGNPPTGNPPAAEAGPATLARTAFVRAGAPPPTLAEQMQIDVTRRLLAQNANFPHGRMPDIRPLVETFVLSPATALAALSPPDPANPQSVDLPLTVLAGVDEAVPGTARIFRDAPSGVNVMTLMELVLNDLRQMSGPQIVAVLIATSGLFGLLQLWRHRRRD